MPSAQALIRAGYPVHAANPYQTGGGMHHVHQPPVSHQQAHRNVPANFQQQYHNHQGHHNSPAIDSSQYPRQQQYTEQIISPPNQTNDSGYIGESSGVPANMTVGHQHYHQSSAHGPVIKSNYQPDPYYPNQQQAINYSGHQHGFNASVSSSEATVDQLYTHRSPAAATGVAPPGQSDYFYAYPNSVQSGKSGTPQGYHTLAPSSAVSHRSSGRDRSGSDHHHHLSATSLVVDNASGSYSSGGGHPNRGGSSSTSSKKSSRKVPPPLDLGNM